MIRFENLDAGYDGQPVLHEITLRIPHERLSVLVGPNGSGKSTLLKAAAGLLPPLRGSVLLQEKTLSDFTPRQLARRIAVLPQTREVPAITVERLALHGRYPHLGFARRPGEADRLAVERALTLSGAAPLRTRSLHSLSGGERQRAYLAMVLAQDTDVLLWDEPTTFLDIGYQITVLDLAKSLVQKGKTVVLVLHDLAAALTYGDFVALLDGGRLRFSGAPGELLSTGLIEQTFGVTPHCFTADAGRTEYYFTK